jgi:AraC-like DNA-binding protein
MTGLRRSRIGGVERRPYDRRIRRRRSARVQPIPLIRAGMIRPALDWLGRRGIAEPPELRSVRRLVYDPRALLPAAVAGAVFLAAERAAATTEFGLDLGETTPLLETADWGAVLARAPNVGAAIQIATVASRRFNTAQRLWAMRRADEVWLQHRLGASIVAGRDAGHAYTLGLLLQLLRLGMGRDWRPLEIHLECARPPHAVLLEDRVQRRVVYERDATAIVFPESVLAAPYPRFLRHAPAVAGALVPADSLDTSARQLVDALIDLGSADLRSAAAAIHVSERSLQRRLQAAGLQFKDLVEEARFARARRLLAERSAKIVEISNELGYSDSANFTRAFRRWSGVAPQTFRRSI